ncbi:histone deacetylase HDT1-like [Henckelia pumila]|uniref:histone deacetylase HDT1-like n=1 Tax=Henckelia pumila TaxID=405737 RepID=UPI003C6E22B1
MEFWGVEVKSGEPLKVQPEPGKLIHISQAALGEVKDVEGAKYVPLLLKIDGKTLVLGSLSAEERTQMMLDLVIEREFELSHDWKNGSVYVLGYIADDQTSGKMKQNLGDVKVAKTADAAKAGNKKEEQPVSHEDEDDSESDSDDSEEDSEDYTDGSFSSEEEPPKEQQTKKRPADSAREAPVVDKKAKTSTPNKQGKMQLPCG